MKLKIKQIVSSSSGTMTWYARWQNNEEDGMLYTPHGLCQIDNSKPGLFLLFHYHGRQYRRFWHGENPSNRYAVTLAKRFVDEIVNGIFDEGETNVG